MSHYRFALNGRSYFSDTVSPSWTDTFDKLTSFYNGQTVTFTVSGHQCDNLILYGLYATLDFIADATLGDTVNVSVALLGTDNQVQFTVCNTFLHFLQNILANALTGDINEGCEVC